MDKAALVRIIQESIPGINEQGIAAIMGNIRLETDNFQSLHEYAMTYENIFEKKDGKYVKNIPSIRKNLTDNGYGPNASKSKIAEFNGLSETKRLGIEYMGDKNADYGGGTGPLMLTFANYGGNQVKKERFEQIAKDMGYDDFNVFMSKVNTDGEFGLKATLAYYKKYEPTKFTAEKLNNTTVQELGDGTINPGRDWISDSDWNIFQSDADAIVKASYTKPLDSLSDQEIEDLSDDDKEFYGLTEEAKVVAHKKIHHTVQLAIGDENLKGGLTNAQENKLEELGITLIKRGEGNLTFYEVEVDSAEDAEKLMKQLQDEKFFTKNQAGAFIKSEQINDDGSKTKLTKKEVKIIQEKEEKEVKIIQEEEKPIVDTKLEAINVKEDSDWTSRVYDTKTKKWYNVSVKYNADNTDYDLVITDYETREVLDNNNEIFQSVKEEVIEDNLNGRNTFSRKKERNGTVTYSSHGGHGRFQLADKPLVTEKDGKKVYHNDNTATISASKSSQETERKKEAESEYEKKQRDKLSGADKYEKWKKDSADDIAKLKRKEENLKYITVGSTRYNKERQEIKALKIKIKEGKININNYLYNQSINNAVATENNYRDELKVLQQQVKSYVDADEVIPDDLKKKIDIAQRNYDASRNRVKLLQSQGSVKTTTTGEKRFFLNKKNEETYIPDPVQDGTANKLVINDDGTVNSKKSIEKSKEVDVEVDVEEEEVIVSATDEPEPLEANQYYSDLEGNLYYKNDDGAWSLKQNTSGEDNSALLTEDDHLILDDWNHQMSIDKGFTFDIDKEWANVATEDVDDREGGALFQITDKDQLDLFGSAGVVVDANLDADEGKDSPWTAKNLGGTIEKGVSGLMGVVDTFGGPSAIVSYLMGRKGLKEAMKEVKPMAQPELSPLFMQHFIQSKELAKQGFAPDEERKIRKEIDNAYQHGLENAVRGTAGNRAKFIANSGILDSRRSAALLDFAAKDDAVEKQNQQKYGELMMFKENFDASKTQQRRAEDMEMQLKNKEGASKFAAAAFSNLMSSMNSNSGIMNKLMMNKLLALNGGDTSQSFYDYISKNFTNKE
jgi:hypothetical protein